MFTKRYYLKDLSEFFKDSEAYFDYFEIAHLDFEKSKLKRPALVVVPGGGYQFVANREAEPIALRFLVEGFNTFVITYSINKKYPAPHLELAFVIDFINKHHEEFMIIQDKISLVGFSAGGHLVASYSCYYKELAELLKIDSKGLKPLSIGLAYPVIHMDPSRNAGTVQVITEKDPELMEKMSVEKHITKEYPPTFIFTTKPDDCVPINNSTMLVEVLNRKGVENEFHLFENGGHGGSLFTNAVYETTEYMEEFAENKRWPEYMSKFIFKLLNK